MKLEIVMQLIGRWGGTLKFFPSDPDARFGIAEEIASMARTEDQVRWLVKRVAQIYTDWPGILEVRAVFCTAHRPADGVEASLGTSSPAYASLVGDAPPGATMLAAPNRRQIAGDVEPSSADNEMAELIRKVFAKRDPLADVKLASDEEIERIKKLQDSRRKESKPWDKPETIQ